MRIFHRPLLVGTLISASALFAGGSIVLSVLQLSCVRSRQQQEGKKYKLYCVNQKVEIGTRTLENMRSARGDQVYLIASFDNLPETEKATRHYGGVGSQCLCTPDEKTKQIKCEPIPTSPCIVSIKPAPLFFVNRSCL